MKAGFDIKLARPEDAREVASVLAESFAEYEPLYTAEGFAATMPTAGVIEKRLEEGATWVAVSEGQVVGTVSVVPEKESLYIRSMAVLPAARGAGIGEQLLTEIESYAAARGYRRLFLSTTPFLHRAIRLYEKFGFEPGDEPPRDLYGTPLLTMSKNLSGPGEK
jgi:GNAT superfamily N-acetyltransferase